MQGLHRLGRTDRTLLWGTAALIAFTLGAVAVARTDGGPVVGADDSRLCYNSAGVGAACLPPPADFEEVAIPPGTSPSTSPSAAPSSPPGAAPVRTSTAPSPRPPRPPASKKATRPAWAVGVAYSAGTQVTYQGGVYACLQPHTSQVDWSPVAAPALWSRVS